MLLLKGDEVRKRLDEIQNYRGWLPFQFDCYVNLSERHKFLTLIGLEEEVTKKNREVQKGIRDTKPNDDVYMDKLLRQWIHDNPQFHTLVIDI